MHRIVRYSQNKRRGINSMKEIRILFAGLLVLATMMPAAAKAYTEPMEPGSDTYLQTLAEKEAQVDAQAQFGEDEVLGVTADSFLTEETSPADAEDNRQTALTVDVDIGQPGRNSDSFAVGEVHTEIIRCSVPEALSGARRYTITNTLDHRLTYQMGSVRVTLYGAAGEELAMEPGIHYTLTEGKTSEGDRRVDRFIVSLTSEGRLFVENKTKGAENPEIRVQFRAAINENAAMGETIPAQAHLDFTDAAGMEHAADSDKPEVHTGGIHILKTDAGGRKLSGAVFRIARLATGEEAADDTVRKEQLVLEEEELTVVFVDFYGSKDLSGERGSQVTTDEQGEAVIYGLAYGTYYLVEARAPEGFNQLTQPIAVIIDGASHMTEKDGWKDSQGNAVDNTVHIVNTRFVLPQSGGTGSRIYIITGLALAGAAGFLLLSNRKKAGFF